jgi:hypothetical protein
MVRAGLEVHGSGMTSGAGSQRRTRPAPSALCRLCSATALIDAPTTDQLRIQLRAFMAEHRHEGLADIVIDIRDDDDRDEDESAARQAEPSVIPR